MSSHSPCSKEWEDEEEELGIGNTSTHLHNSDKPRMWLLPVMIRPLQVLPECYHLNVKNMQERENDGEEEIQEVYERKRCGLCHTTPTCKNVVLVSTTYWWWEWNLVSNLDNLHVHTDNHAYTAIQVVNTHTYTVCITDTKTTCYCGTTLANPDTIGTASGVIMEVS